MVANKVNLNPFKDTKIFSFERKVGVVRYVVSFLGVLVIGAILIAAQGENPVNAAWLIVKGALEAASPSATRCAGQRHACSPALPVSSPSNPASITWVSRARCILEHLWRQ